MRLHSLSPHLYNMHKKHTEENIRRWRNGVKKGKMKCYDFSEIFVIFRMPSSGMWRSVNLVRTDVLEESIASIITVKRIDDLGITFSSN
jgi:hypothetical protein